MNAELQVRKTIIRHSLIQRGDTVVLGLSGGPDSLCLLYILKDLSESPSFDFDLKAYHLDHMIRGEEAEKDAEFLKKICSRMNIPLTVSRLDVIKIAAETGESTEEAGRRLRQKELLELAGSFPGGKAALAHNKDDQAETVMMRILRGTGVHGLSSMEYKRPDGVIRPLLDTPRTEIERYCRKNQLTPRIDSTNSSTEYTRNKIRLELLPQIAEDYNPSVKDGLVRLAFNAREDDSCLNAIAQDAYKECILCDDETDSIVFSKKKLKDLHPAIFKRVIRIGFANLGLDEDIAFVHLNSLEKTVREGNNKSLVQFPCGYSAMTGAGKVVLKAPE